MKSYRKIKASMVHTVAAGGEIVIFIIFHTFAIPLCSDVLYFLEPRAQQSAESIRDASVDRSVEWAGGITKNGLVASADFAWYFKFSCIHRFIDHG